MNREEIIKKAYAAFNNRNIGAVLALFDPEIDWPNGWEGGYVHGHDEVRDYWTRQWAEIDPNVEPTAFENLSGGRLKVTVHQFVKDKNGDVLFDGMIAHIYSFKDKLIKKMEINEE